MNHFSCNAFIDPTAVLGRGVKVWHFSVVLSGVAIGENVSIGSGCEIGRGSIIGKNTRIGHGVFLPANSLIGENTFIGPGTICTDDKFPVVNNHDYDAQPPNIGDNVSIGAGCVILPGVRIHKGARIGAGSVVAKDVPSNSLVYGERAYEKMKKEWR